MTRRHRLEWRRHPERAAWFRQWHRWAELAIEDIEFWRRQMERGRALDREPVEGEGST